MLYGTSPHRSHSGDFEPCSQSTTTTINHLSKILLCSVSIGFILTDHSPQVYGKPSGHGSYCLVFLTGIVQESQKALVGTCIFSYPYLGCFNEIGSKLSPASLCYRAISKRPAALNDHWGQNNIFCQFCFMFKSVGLEDFSGELSGDDRADAGVSQ